MVNQFTSNPTEDLESPPPPRYTPALSTTCMSQDILGSFLRTSRSLKGGQGRREQKASPSWRQKHCRGSSPVFLFVTAVPRSNLFYSTTRFVLWPWQLLNKNATGAVLSDSLNLLSLYQTDRCGTMIGASSTMKKDGSAFIFQNKSIQEFIAKQLNASGVMTQEFASRA